MQGRSGECPPAAAGSRGEDAGAIAVRLPNATVAKAAKELLPEGVRISKDACDLLVECCSEFIGMVSSEASGLATKVIGPQHVVEALQVRPRARPQPAAHVDPAADDAETRVRCILHGGG